MQKPFAVPAETSPVPAETIYHPCRKHACPCINHCVITQTKECPYCFVLWENQYFRLCRENYEIV